MERRGRMERLRKTPLRIRRTARTGRLRAVAVLAGDDI